VTWCVESLAKEKDEDNKKKRCGRDDGFSLMEEIRGGDGGGEKGGGELRGGNDQDC